MVSPPPMGGTHDKESYPDCDCRWIAFFVIGMPLLARPCYLTTTLSERVSLVTR